MAGSDRAMISKPPQFDWKIGKKPPLAEEHSVIKVSILRQYLDEYFDVVRRSPAHDPTRITLVDGMCGGGLYRTKADGLSLGSPLAMLAAVRDAEERLQENLGTKRQQLDPYFIFVDSDIDHTDYLRDALLRDGWFEQYPGNRIKIITGDIQNEINGILLAIRARQRNGRAIFNLDQCGYTTIDFEMTEKIFADLPSAEAVITIAIDNLLNQVMTHNPNEKVLETLRIPMRFAIDMASAKNDTAGRFVAQKAIASRMLGGGRERYMTPFLIKPVSSRRHMMIAHLARHPKARDVMLGVHWEAHNRFCNTDGLHNFALSFDAKAFDFDSTEHLFDMSGATALREALIIDLANRISATDNISIESIVASSANTSAARYDHWSEAAQHLHEIRDIEIISPDGKRRRLGSRPTVRDRLTRSTTPPLFSILPKK